MDECLAQGVIEPLPTIQGEALKFHTKLTPIYPFDCAALNRQGLRPVREEDTDMDICTHKGSATAPDRASAQRKVGDEPLAHAGRPPEYSRILRRVSRIDPMIGPSYHQTLHTMGFYRS